jgi:hypothetical protein
MSVGMTLLGIQILAQIFAQIVASALRRNRAP